MRVDYRVSQFVDPWCHFDREHNLTAPSKTDVQPASPTSRRSCRTLSACFLKALLTAWGKARSRDSRKLPFGMISAPMTGDDSITAVGP